ncbi:carboxylate-amine ligase [Sphaerisporangium perillae]|uniref:carboxylate-amine ligase n=1 Tax=Sphaerisporangium perillae TaxID=2935860 RepID=UPI00200F23A3|nr:glutamate--cysteine ligase [Sphaerisporangium perillae]
MMEFATSQRSLPGPRLTMGMEEEFLLIDPGSGRLCPLADQVLRRIDGPMACQFVPELTKCQIESNSAVHTDLRRLAADLLRLRNIAADAAEAAGTALTAGGTCLDGCGGMPALSSSPRYWRMYGQYRALLYGQGVCGCHVHVGIADREEAVQVSNHVRPWLPLLQALTANSPITDGMDTGYASWRAMQWARWPSAGPPPFFLSAEHYENLLAGLRASGAILDRGMVYWLVRLSHHLPTLEFRTADTCATVEEAIVLAGLVRALAATALADVRRGVPAPLIDHVLLCAAYWRAARDGMEGDAFDLLTGRVVPSWLMAERLLERVGQSLADSGDLSLVTAALHRLRRRGSAAARQRVAYRRRSRVTDVAELLIRQTRAVPEFLLRPGPPARPAVAGILTDAGSDVEEEPAGL